MSKIRIGVVGLGFGGQVHVPAFRADSRCEVTAIAGTNLDRAHAVAARLQIPGAAGGWQDIVLDTNIDAVSIAVPPALQAEIAIAAIAAGKAVFCEKPLAASGDEARRMCEAAASAGVANMVDFEFPEIPCWKRAGELIASGAIGKLRHIAVSWHVETYANRLKLQSWKTSGGGGTLNLLLPHTLHYLEWFAGPVQDLIAASPSAEALADSPGTLTTLGIRFLSGTGASVSASTDAFMGAGHRLEFYGDEGALRLENTTADYIRGFRLFHAQRSTGRLDECTPSENGAEESDGRLSPVRALTARFVDWMTTGRSSTPDLRSGERVQELLDAARQSAELGRRVATWATSS